jgi:succinylglutamate desuccinylase
MPHTGLLQEQLRQTEAFIAQALEKISQQERRISALPPDTPQQIEADKTLTAFRKSLEVMRRHREFIADEIREHMAR